MLCFTSSFILSFSFIQPTIILLKYNFMLNTLFTILPRKIFTLPSLSHVYIFAKCIMTNEICTMTVNEKSSLTSTRDYCYSARHILCTREGLISNFFYCIKYVMYSWKFLTAFAFSTSYDKIQGQNNQI